MHKLLEFLILLTLGAVLTGCGAEISPSTPAPKGIELSFETIEQDNWGRSEEVAYSAQEPRFVLINSVQDISRLGTWVSPTAIEQLTTMNFDRYFAIAVFRGRQASSGYDTIIKRVTQQGDRIVIYVEFWEPSPYWEIAAVATSPYHLIKVRREVGDTRKFKVILQSPIITPTPPFR